MNASHTPAEPRDPVAATGEESAVTYAFLLLPSHNRVYAQASVALAQAELEVFGQTVLEGRLDAVERTEFGGVPYLSFRVRGGLGERDLRFLSNLSSLYALFEVADGLLRPLPLRRLDKFASDLLTIQKYPGKTNEDFTKLLLNVTALATEHPERLLTGELRVLDPLCGRGTTLNQAVMYGLDAAGVDHDGKSFEAYNTFLRQWLKNSRLKHQAETSTVRRNRKNLGRRLQVRLGETKELYKKGQAIEVTVVHADTTASGEFFRRNSFDLIVTDAPYGVRHGSRSAQALSRSPVPLLTSALPVWTELLRPGGALGISWNTHVARRAELADLLAGHGYTVLDGEPYHGFRHRVDQSIDRDLIVARLPRPTDRGR